MSRITIRPSKGWEPLHLDELWAHRELLYFLTWRDIKVRYKQTLLGALWAILQPVLTMVVFSIFFGKLGNIPSDGVPYPVFAYVALLPWQLFANSVSEAGNSLVSSQNLITKTYFPRIVIPLAPILAALVDFVIAFTVLIAIMAFYHLTPGFAVLLLPLFLLLAITTAMAVGLWLAALNVEYRDIRYTIPFLIQIWMFVTPVAYPASLVPSAYRVLYSLNPMAGVVDGFRWALLGRGTESAAALAASVGVMLTLLITGLFYFRRVEQSFADVV